jgi:hypothetical protein
VSVNRAAASVALCLPLAALAAEWIKVPAPDLNQHWYDRSKLTAENESITYWRRVDFHVPQRSKSGMAQSGMYRERIDCRAHTYRTLGYLLYAKNGSVIENMHTPDATAEPIIPETVGDRFDRVMCALAPQVLAAQKAATEAAITTPRTVEELRQDIESTEARLRILREQLDAQLKQTATPRPGSASEAVH